MYRPNALSALGTDDNVPDLVDIFEREATQNARPSRRAKRETSLGVEEAEVARRSHLKLL